MKTTVLRLALVGLAGVAGCVEEHRPVPARSVTCRRALGPASSQPVHWAVPTAEAARLKLDAFCAGVGPALVQWPAAADTIPPAAHGLVAVAWNVGIGAGDLDALIRDLRAGELTDRNAPGDFVLLLQEAHRADGTVPVQAELPPPAAGGGHRPPPAGRAGVAAVARRYGLWLFYAPSMRNGLVQDAAPFEDRGNAILATAPLRRLAVHELTAGRQRRTVLFATLDVRLPDGRVAPVRLISTHFDNFSIRRPVASLGAIRAEQAAELLRLLPDSDPILLGADLNTWMGGTDETAFELLRPMFPEPASPGGEPTAERLGIPRALDYLLLRAPEWWTLHTRRIDWRYGSDHHPVLGWIIVG
ncbi:MAG: endonuclease/exonuclease/phosphatase family protein [Longimicrobiales bacterium]